ncbi:MAG: TRAP transporter large permease subunit [Candidatus Rokubacteria bacterium]|nr:TRAP transporter large permease subunit [Candidatus Rokubacteria bacterium]MBI2200155.1 TRAP transporter large permease subunit [Candidatus Rokubacteria bacterium]
MDLSAGNLYLGLFLTMIASLILGMGVPTTPTYIIMATLTAPALVAVGRANEMEIPIIAVHLFVFYFGILADDTPPVGLAA